MIEFLLFAILLAIFAVYLVKEEIEYQQREKENAKKHEAYFQHLLGTTSKQHESKN